VENYGLEFCEDTEDYKSLPDLNTVMRKFPLLGSFNFKTIDGVIVRKAGPKKDNTKKQLFVFPLQVTVAKKHKDSHATFFKEWKQWIHGLEEFDVVPEFIWISEKGADDITHDESSKWLAHLERNISLHAVNVQIGYLYDGAKKSQRIQNGVPLNEDFGMSIIGRSKEGAEADGHQERTDLALPQRIKGV